jgi:hypothetical protein
VLAASDEPPPCRLGRAGAFNPYAHALRAAGGLLQGAGRACDQIIGRQGNAVEVFTADLAADRTLEMQHIMPVDEHEDGFQQVIAVRPAAGDMQKD